MSLCDLSAVYTSILSQLATYRTVSRTGFPVPIAFTADQFSGRVEQSVVCVCLCVRAITLERNYL